MSERVGRHRLMLAIGFAAVAPGAQADGFTVDKVYHPYVQPLERELEYRVLYLNGDDPLIDATQVHRLGLGRSFNDHIFAELYVIGEKKPGNNMSVAGYEAELKWQLTEQGEYSADWGVLFEFETERGSDAQEFATTALVEKEIGQWAATANLSAVYEWGSDINNEWESVLAAQLRYRYRQAFEPAVELYSGDFSKGFGPVALGTVRFRNARKLHWETGVIFGVDSKSPDQTLRLLFEYEF